MNPVITPQEVGIITFFLVSLFAFVKFLIDQFQKLLDSINAGYAKLRDEQIEERKLWYDNQKKKDEDLARALDGLTSELKFANNRHRDYDT